MAIPKDITSPSKCPQLAPPGHAVPSETARSSGSMTMFRTFPQTHYALCTVWTGSYFLFFLKQNRSQQAARIPPSVPPHQGTATWRCGARGSPQAQGSGRREQKGNVHFPQPGAASFPAASTRLSHYRHFQSTPCLAALSYMRFFFSKTRLLYFKDKRDALSLTARPSTSPKHLQLQRAVLV